MRRAGRRNRTGRRAVIAALALCLLLPRSARAAAPEDDIPRAAERTEETVFAEQTIGVLPDADAALPEAVSFAVTIPEGFLPDEVPGRYICERYPLDAANITVTSTPLGEGEQYTNAEKRAREAAGEPVPAARQTAYTQLTAKLFEEGANEALDDGLELRVTSFVHITVKRRSDGASFPGYRVSAAIDGALKPVTEEIYLILSADRIFTVTYAQASDDEFEALFRKSAASISVY